MARPAATWVCGECGAESAKWLGRCPGCASWNTLVEEARSDPRGAGQVRRPPVRAVPLETSAARLPARLASGVAELDRVLGGGAVAGSAVLVGGDPGIGKSTLLLQALEGLARPGAPALYISGEESEDQVRLRAARLGLEPRSEILLLADTNLESVIAEAERTRAPVLIADSVQTLWSERLPSAPGSVAQVREVAARFVALAKTTGTVVFLVGHVTKDGAIAGPRTLEHMVDTVLYFEGDRGRSHRVLRAIKNRFGPAGELGVFEMAEQGLVGIENASAQLLAERARNAPGSAVLAALEGSRALLVEVQALAVDSVTALPRRTANGFDQSRLALLVAVLERRVGLALGRQDLFVNIAGGLELSEPAADLAVAVALASTTLGRVVDPDVLVFGEVGLMGELRAVGRADLRLAEAARLGFRRVVLPQGNGASRGEGLEGKLDLEVVASLGQAIEAVLRYP